MPEPEVLPLETITVHEQLEPVPEVQQVPISQPDVDFKDTWHIFTENEADELVKVSSRSSLDSYNNTSASKLTVSNSFRAMYTR